VCADESVVIYAAPTGSTTSSCTQNAPCSLDRAFAISDSTRSTIKLAPGVYDTPITVTNKRVRVIAKGATISSSSGSTLTVYDAGSLSLEGGTIVNTSTGGGLGAVVARSTNNVDVPELVLRDSTVESLKRGLHLEKAQATVVRSTIRATGDSALGGINGTIATVDRSSLVGNGYMILSADASVLRFTNSIIGPSNTGDDVFAAVGGAVVVSFSTVLGVATCTNDPAVCGGPGANGVCFDNSIVANLRVGAPPNAITGQACVSTYTLAFPQTAALPGTGNKVGINPKFKNPSANDLHLDTGSPAIDAASPTATLGTDFEGKTRPQGAQRDLGAFEYP